MVRDTDSHPGRRYVGAGRAPVCRRVSHLFIFIIHTQPNSPSLLRNSPQSCPMLQRSNIHSSYVVLSSVCGSVIAPIAGGFITTYLSWQWVFWISLIFGFVAQALHFFVPETRSDIMLDRRAQYCRRTGEHDNLYGPMELKGTFWQRISFKEVVKTCWLPFHFLITEPIVTFLSLLSGFSDALIFTGLDSFPLVLSKWNFSVIAVGLSFIPLFIGCEHLTCIIRPLPPID